jgi:L-asparaginase
VTDHSVLILATGGTFDKVYIDGKLEIGPPAATWLLDIAGISGTFRIESVLAKDSLDLTDEDRAVLAERVRCVTNGGVVITHGTDTMTATAEYLQDHQAVQVGVTVVVTGAMQPARMRDSDAMFNLGAAISAAQTLPGSTYVVMSGRIFPAGKAVKNRADGRFVEA